MGKYDLDIRVLIKQMLPISLRGKFFVEFIYVLIAPIWYIYLNFIREKKVNEDSLSYNSQYPNLQRLLNDRFDSEKRRIKVKDGGGNIDETLIFPNEELKPWHLGQVIIYPSTMWGYAPFVVLLPKNADSDFTPLVIDQIKRTVDNYKFLGTKYNIEFYE